MLSLLAPDDGTFFPFPSSGERQLCDAYLGGRLRPQENATESELHFETGDKNNERSNDNNNNRSNNNSNNIFDEMADGNYKRLRSGNPDGVNVVKRYLSKRLGVI